MKTAQELRAGNVIMVGSEPLDEARFITVKGVPVSLRDIRENIVFRHWKDPKVIYGFWRGEIGGPSIQKEAFNADNVARLLQRGAVDFVNSLRGTQMDGERLEVATLYAEVAPFYFRDFEGDLRRHLAAFAEEPTAQILANTRAVSATISEHGIADLHGLAALQVARKARWDFEREGDFARAHALVQLGMAGDGRSLHKVARARQLQRVVAAQAATKWRPIRARARSEWNKRCGENAFEKVQMQFLLTFFCFGKKVRNKKDAIAANQRNNLAHQENFCTSSTA